MFIKESVSFICLLSSSLRFATSPTFLNSSPKSISCCEPVLACFIKSRSYFCFKANISCVIDSASLALLSFKRLTTSRILLAYSLSGEIISASVTPCKIIESTTFPSSSIRNPSEVNLYVFPLTLKLTFVPYFLNKDLALVSKIFSRPPSFL